jgi:lipoate-protein ligase B
MRTLQVSDLGAGQGYADVLALQERTHAQRVAGEAPDCLFLLEHRPVYTLGRSADASNVLYCEEALREAGIECVATSRGGDVTYHGPGQLVGYPIIHLGEAGLRVVEYVTALEEVIIRAAASFGVTAARDPRNRGAWVGGSKLAAIGIRVSRQVAMHGFALNVNTRLDDYRGIVACGLRDAGITSMSQLLGRPVEMQDVKEHVIRAFKETLHYGEP